MQFSLGLRNKMYMGLSAIVLITTLQQLLLSTSSIYGYDGPSLYKADDPVTQLSAETFDGVIFGSSHIWVVELYATWCGHCQHFAPLWVDYAGSIGGWRSVVKVAVVACSQPINAQLCVRLGVRGYPSVFVYRPGAQPGQAADHLDYKSRTVAGLRDATVNYISWLLPQLDPQLITAWPRLTPLRSLTEMSGIWSSGTDHVFLITEQTDDGLSKQLILELSHAHPSTTVVWMLGDAAITSLPVPALLLYQPNGTFTVLLEGSKRVPEYISKVKAVVNGSGIGSGNTVTSLTTVAPHTLFPSAVPTKSAIEYSTYYRLHMQDIESSLYYSLFIEVPGMGTLKADSLRTIKKHLNLITTHIALRQPVRQFMKSILTWLRSQTSVSPLTWLQRLNATQKADSYLPQTLHWVGCAGSEGRYRGYPCSLWMIYHALTVNDLTRHSRLGGRGKKLSRPREVLQTMRDYVRHFFSCRHCADHFATVSANITRLVKSERDAVLWLWHTHNDVNARLAGDVTEDPQHPKMQFPPSGACPACWTMPTRGPWNELEVLYYLQSVYGREHVIMDSKYDWSSVVAT